MSEVVTDTGSTNTLDAAAERMESFFETTEPTEEVEIEESEDESIEAEAEADAGEEAEETAPDEEIEEAPLELESFNDLIEALEVDSDYLDNLKTKVKVQGEELEVSFQELKAGYQKGNDYAKNVESLKRQREEFEQLQAQRMHQFEQDHTQNALIVQQIEQSIVSQMDSEEMAQLRQSNQQEWLARRYDLQDRLNGLQQVKQEAGMRYQQMQQALAQEQQQNLEKRLAKEAEMLSSKIPDWGTETQTKINSYLTDYGYSPEELQGVADHRYVEIANKARMWDEYQAQAEVATKKVKKAPPKLVKPTSKRPSPQRDALSKAKARLRKTNSLQDAAKVIEQLI